MPAYNSTHTGAEIDNMVTNGLLRSEAVSTYLSKTDAASTYLTQANAAANYLNKTQAASTYLTQANASTTYLTQANATSSYLSKIDAANTYLTQTNASSTYALASDLNIVKKAINLQTKEVNGNTYILIFDHHIVNAGGFIDAAQATFNFQYQKFSILGLIPILSYNNAVYQFRLEYPNENAIYYNEWSQTSNPLISSDTVTGYTAIHMDYQVDSFGGLALSSHSSDTLMDCSPGVSSWWYCIGAYVLYQGGMPGPSTTQAQTVVNQVRLWLRIN